jgi:hypothetical protein
LHETPAFFSSLISIVYLPQRYKEVETTEAGVFKGVSDRFNGITIDSTTETCNDAQFDGILSSKCARSCDDLESNELFVLKLF